MDPWFRVTTPRKEVREGRSFNPDEFAIALEQVVAGTAPEDYRDPEKFFSRTCFTRALKEHAGMVLQRLSGKTEGAAPVQLFLFLCSDNLSFIPYLFAFFLCCYSDAPIRDLATFDPAGFPCVKPSGQCRL